MADLRDAWRFLRRHPWTTAVAVTTLAAAIGVNSGMFSVVNALLVRPLDVRNPHELVSIAMRDAAGERRALSWPMVGEIAARQRVLSGLFAWVGGVVVNVEAGGGLGLGNVWAVTEDFHAELGQPPVAGRWIDARDGGGVNRGSGSAVAVLGHGFWERRFNADPGVIGLQVQVEGHPFTVIGVAPRWFTGMESGVAPDITIPLAMLPIVFEALGLDADIEDPGRFEIEAAGRLAPGVTRGQAQTHLDAIWGEVTSATAPAGWPQTERDWLLSTRPSVTSAARGVDAAPRVEFVRPLYTFAVLSGIVLVAACLHVASVLLASTPRRSHALAVHLALGAGRRRLIGRAIAQSLVVAAAGAALGLLIAQPVSRALVAFLAPDPAIPLVLKLGPDLYVLAVTAACGALAAVLCSGGVVWFGLQRSPLELLGRHGGNAPTTLNWPTRILMSVHVAFSVMLLVSAGTLLRHADRIASTPMGFEQEGLSVTRLHPRPRGYERMDERIYAPALLERVRSSPGVQAAGLVNRELAGGFEHRDIVAPALPRPVDPLRVVAAVSVISPGFLDTIGLGHVDGRDFAWSDDRSRPRVALVSRALAERLFPASEAIGERVQIGADPRWTADIVGVVDDGRLFDLRTPASPLIFLPWLQEPDLVRGAGQLVVRFGHARRCAGGG